MKHFWQLFHAIMSAVSPLVYNLSMLLSFMKVNMHNDISITQSKTCTA